MAQYIPVLVEEMANAQRSRVRWGVTLAAVGLVVAACGDDGGGSDDAPSGSRWSSDPAVSTVISDVGGEQAIPKVVPLGSGGFTVSWFSNPDLTNYDVRLQRYDAGANELWEPGGTVVSDNRSDSFITDYVAAGDGDGNTILVIQDSRTGSPNIYAYKVSVEGEQLWGADGVVVTSDDQFVAPRPSFVVTGGELSFSFVRDVDADTSEVVVQRLAADGTLLWGDGAVLRGAAGERFGQPVIAEGPDGGLYVTMTVGEDFATGVEALRMQRVDGDGAIVWEEPIELAPELPLPAESSLVPDGAGGAFVAWNDTDLRSLVQHVDADGTLGFGDGGVPASTQPDRLQIRPVLVPHDDDLVVVWLDTDEGQGERGVSAQRLDRTGARQWGDAGRAVVEPTRADLRSFVPIPNGDAVRVFFAQGDSQSSDPSLLARLEAVDVAASGEVVGDRVEVSSRLADVSSLEVAAVDGQFVAAWNERSDDRLDALMQAVDP